jgi:hypothetical protein
LRVRPMEGVVETHMDGRQLITAKPAGQQVSGEVDKRSQRVNRPALDRIGQRAAGIWRP